MEPQPEYETQPIEQPTAEIIEEQETLPVKVESQIELYQGVATHDFTDDQQKKLLEKAPDEYIEIRPDGIVYMPEIRYRYILNTVFGPGKWALIRVQNPLYYDDKVGYHGSLFINGKFLSESIGEQTYRENNPLMSKFTAIESAKSDCITRCCKDLGIAWNLWDPKFIKAWKEKHAISVWCVSTKDGKKKLLWRLKTDKPIDQWPWKEGGSKKSEPGKKMDGNGKKETGKKTPPDEKAQGVVVKIAADVLTLVKLEAPENANDNEKNRLYDELFLKRTGKKTSLKLLELPYKDLCTIHGKLKKEVAIANKIKDEFDKKMHKEVKNLQNGDGDLPF